MVVARIILAIRGWQGSVAMRFPIDVILPFSSMAPSAVSSSFALNTPARGGIVSHGRASASLSPKAAV